MASADGTRSVLVSKDIVTFAPPCSRAPPVTGDKFPFISYAHSDYLSRGADRCRRWSMLIKRVMKYDEGSDDNGRLRIHRRTTGFRPPLSREPGPVSPRRPQ